MDLRELMNKLDAINEGNTLSEEHKLARELFLKEGIDPLAEAVTMDDAWAWAKGLGIGVLSAIKKIGIPITVAYEIYMAWEEIKKLPKDMPRSQFKAEVAKIITRAVGQTGLVWFGALVGGVVAGTIGLTTGPGAIILAIAGAIGSAYMFGDNVDKMADALVDFFYKAETPSATTAPAQPAGQSATPTQAAPAATSEPEAQPVTSGGKSNLVSKIQSTLQAAGFDVGQHGIDGYFGPDTLAAFKAYKKSKNIDSTPDLEVMLQLAGLQMSESTLSEVERMSLLRQRLDELDEAFRIRPAVRHGADALGVTTKGMEAVKELGQTVVIGSGRKAQTWSYDKSLGEYVSANGMRKSPQDLKSLKDQADAAATAAAAQRQSAKGLKTQPNDQIQYGAGSQRQTYTYTQNGWVDANGKVVKNQSIIADLEKANVAKKTGQAQKAQQQAQQQTQAGPGSAKPKQSTAGATTPASSSINTLKNSKFAKAITNPKVLTLVAALGTLGYLFNRDGNIFSGHPDSAASADASGQGAMPAGDGQGAAGADSQKDDKPKDNRTPLEKWYDRY